MTAVHFDCDVATVYGRQFTEALSAPPTSAFVAEGSANTVFRPQRIT